jgi:hypothetical protein
MSFAKEPVKITSSLFFCGGIGPDRRLAMGSLFILSLQTRSSSTRTEFPIGDSVGGNIIPPPHAQHKGIGSDPDRRTGSFPPLTLAYTRGLTAPVCHCRAAWPS